MNVPIAIAQPVTVTYQPPNQNAKTDAQNQNALMTAVNQLWNLNLSVLPQPPL
jgi:hypothetical protein